MSNLVIIELMTCHFSILNFPVHSSAQNTGKLSYSPGVRLVMSLSTSCSKQYQAVSDVQSLQENCNKSLLKLVVRSSHGSWYSL